MTTMHTIGSCRLCNQRPGCVYCYDCQPPEDDCNEVSRLCTVCDIDRIHLAWDRIVKHKRRLVGRLCEVCADTLAAAGDTVRIVCSTCHHTVYCRSCFQQEHPSGLSVDTAGSSHKYAVYETASAPAPVTLVLASNDKSSRETAQTTSIVGARTRAVEPPPVLPLSHARLESVLQLWCREERAKAQQHAAHMTAMIAPSQHNQELEVGAVLSLDKLPVDPRDGESKVVQRNQLQPDAAAAFASASAFAPASAPALAPATALSTDKKSTTCLGCETVLPDENNGAVCGLTCPGREVKWFASKVCVFFVKGICKRQPGCCVFVHPDRSRMVCIYCRGAGHVLMECADPHVRCMYCSQMGHFGKTLCNAKVRNKVPIVGDDQDKKRRYVLTGMRPVC